MAFLTLFVWAWLIHYITVVVILTSSLTIFPFFSIILMGLRLRLRLRLATETTWFILLRIFLERLPIIVSVETILWLGLMIGVRFSWMKFVVLLFLWPLIIRFFGKIFLEFWVGKFLGVVRRAWFLILVITLFETLLNLMANQKKLRLMISDYLVLNTKLILKE